MDDSRNDSAGTSPTRALLALLGAAALFLSGHTASAQEGLFGKPAQAPSLTLNTEEIRLDVPTPVAGNDLALLLAQAGSGGLSQLKAKAATRFSTHLQEALDRRLREHFEDEDIPLVNQGGFLTFHSRVDAAISKQLTDLDNSDRYETERGTLKVSGEFRYQLNALSGETLQEKRIDLSELRLEQRYRVRTAHRSGETEDSTDEAIETMLDEMAEQLIDRIEDQLEADELGELARL
ncbi:LPS assembly lipoprotein LptE [Microbulbifer guangxiensis]|uniref:LPS assembly lipoprotein LptE n=1 Tax=Microbulbifer guangxiensis TaxID=2904249 RepID=UPI001F029123|nr:LPS assembly lipoprotein LptE [Microbulbifer guangxiensis]